MFTSRPVFTSAPAAGTVTVTQAEGGAVTVEKTTPNGTWERIVDTTKLPVDPSRTYTVEFTAAAGCTGDSAVGISTNPTGGQYLRDVGIGVRFSNRTIYIKNAVVGTFPAAATRFALNFDPRGMRALYAFYVDPTTLRWTAVGPSGLVASGDQIPASDEYYVAVALNTQGDKVELKCYDVATTAPVMYVMAPCYKQVLDAGLSFEDTLRQPAVGLRGATPPRLSCPQTNIALIGVPGQGKSALINALISSLACLPMSAVTESSTAAKGNATLKFSRVSLLELALAGYAPTDYELVLFDMVGMRGARELLAAMQGKMHDNEEWPTPSKESAAAKGSEPTALQAAEAQRVEAQRLAIEGRDGGRLNPLEVAHCAVIVMTAADLMAGAGTQDMARLLLSACDNFSCGENVAIQLPKLLVVSKVDVWLEAQRVVSGPECLLYGEAGPLKALYKAAQDQLGFAPYDVVPMGWLGRASASAVDFSAPDHPGLVALRYLGQRMSQCACMTLRKNFKELLVRGAAATR
jgi:hypothetical protein